MDVHFLDLATLNPDQTLASLRFMQETEQVFDCPMAMAWVPKPQTGMNLIPVPPSVADLRQVPGGLEVGHDACHGSLGYPHLFCDITEPPRRLGVDALEHMCVVRDEPPAMVVARNRIHVFGILGAARQYSKQRGDQGDKVVDQPTGTRSSDGDDRERYDVIVIGGGQAGLAIGYYLKRQGLSFAILESAEAVGAAWRGRWDSLVLFTPRRYSALTGLSLGGDPDGYPTRDEVVAYLEEYARTFELPVHFDSPVRSLGQNERGYAVRAGDREIDANQVVVATGPFQDPRIPEQASGLAPDVFQAHSTAYIRPGGVPSGRLLVVGGGNTGYQIADELATTRDVVLAIGSRQTPLPQKLLGRDLFWWLTKTRLINKSVDTRIGQRARARDTLIGSSARRLRQHGIGLSRALWRRAAGPSSLQTAPNSR